MKKLIPIAVALILIAIIGYVAFSPKVKDKTTYSQEEADLYEYFHLVKKDDVAIILGNELLADRAVYKDGRLYFTEAFTDRYFNDRFYFDLNEKKMLYVMPDDIVSVGADSTLYTKYGEQQDAGYVIWYIGTDGVNYIAEDWLHQYANFSLEFFETPNRLQLYLEWPSEQMANISEDTAVRVLGGTQSPILCHVKAGDAVTILDRMDTWCGVKTADGFIGYVENKCLDAEYTRSLTPVTSYQEPVYASLTRDEKVAIGWHAVASTSGNDTFKTVTEKADALTVIAPTWYSIKDADGTLRSFAKKSYVDSAHKKGLQVWGVVDDFNYQMDTGKTVDLFTLLSTTKSRTALIDSIMEAAESVGLDGINIDFEKVDEATGEHFVEFIRELSVRCRAQGIILSVDNYVPYNYNSYFDLEEQGVMVDYVIIMGYDEHYGGSSEAGSVASIGYVRYGIEKTLEMVPSEKVINALPFYTRLWKTEGTKVTSEAYPMTSVSNVLKTYGMEAEWDEETSQNYAEVVVDGATYQIWCEDNASINVKLNVMANYDLGGVAAWRLGYENSSVWDLIAAYLSN